MTFTKSDEGKLLMAVPPYEALTLRQLEHRLNYAKNTVVEAQEAYDWAVKNDVIEGTQL